MLSVWRRHLYCQYDGFTSLNLKSVDIKNSVFSYILQENIHYVLRLCGSTLQRSMWQTETDPAGKTIYLHIGNCMVECSLQELISNQTEQPLGLRSSSKLKWDCQLESSIMQELKKNGWCLHLEHVKTATIVIKNRWTTRNRKEA